MGQQLNGTGPHLKSALRFFPNGSARPVCGKIRPLFGLAVRHAGLVASERGERWVLGRIVVGRRTQAVWAATA